MVSSVLHGDALTVLKGLADECIHCAVTSPPYYGLRNYGVDGQIGLEETPEQYVQKLVEIFHVLKRVLRSDGTFWLNIGDSYAGSGKGPSNSISRPCQCMSDGSLAGGAAPTSWMKVPESCKPKDLIGIPWMLAFALRADGWYLRSDIPWIKRNSMPSSVRDRPASSIEHIFLFSKSGDALFWTHPEKSNGMRTRPDPDYVYTNRVTKEQTRTPPENWKDLLANDDEDEDGEGNRIGVKLWTRRNLWDGHAYYYDYVATMQPSSESYNKDKRPRGKIRQTVNVNSKYPDEGQFKKQDHTGNETYTGFNARYEDSGNGLRYMRDSDFFFRTWQGLLHNEDGEPIAMVVNPRGYKGAHFACFPVQLVEPMILAGTGEKGVCPECGAPWIRVTEKGEFTCQSWGEHPKIQEAVGGVGATSCFKSGGTQEILTVGWKPSCSCSRQDPVPAAVLDPFSGSGATGVACQWHGRDYVGIELNPDYCNLQHQRLKENK